MPHSLWNGTVAFGMVRVPVKLYSATESKAIRFNERHGPDGAAIEHRRVCVKEDSEVPYAEIVKGYEVSEGSYVALTKQEVAAVDGPTARTIAIEHFVEAEAIDPLYFERPYYLGPGNSAAESYLVLHAALRRSGMVGIGRFVFHNNARLVAVRALGEVIGLQTMRFADEVTPRMTVDEDGAAASAAANGQKIGKRELDTAALLIDSLTSKFEAHKYRDKHREALLELIERKARGEALEAPVSEPATADDELLKALEASLASQRTAKSSTRRPAGGAGSKSAAQRSGGGSRHKTPAGTGSGRRSPRARSGKAGG
jgi:DNA end-binding protein Ku